MATFKPRIISYSVWAITVLLLCSWNQNASFHVVESFSPVNKVVTGPRRNGGGGLIVPNEQQQQAFLKNEPHPHRMTRETCTFTRLKATTMIMEDIHLMNTCIQSINMMIMMMTSTIASAYTHSLTEYPMPTKAMTSSVLCGLGDFISQKRDPTISEIDWDRLRRFAIKGIGGGIIWAIWYDTVDTVVDTSMEMFMSTSSSSSAAASVAASALPDFDSSVAATATTTAAAATNDMDNMNNNNIKVAMSMLLEQFFWCPLVFGIWEIPVATLMNGGRLNSIPREVKDKLGNLLIDNAKIWTPANMVIYSAPLEYRALMGNIVDVLWQSIVATMAADCGSTDTCDVVEVLAMNEEEQEVPTSVPTPTFVPETVMATATVTTDPGVAMVTQFLNTNSNENNQDAVGNEQLQQPSKILQGRRRRQRNIPKIPSIIEP